MKVEEPELIPDDLGVKIGSKFEGFVTRVRDNIRDEIDHSKHAIKMNERIVEVLDQLIEEEQQDLNS